MSGSQTRVMRIGDICDLNPRCVGPKDSSSPVSFIPMPAVSDVDGIVLEHGTRPFSEVAKGYTRFCENDVLFAKITPCMENGKIAVAEGLHNKLGCGSTEFHVLRSRGSILPRYLWYFLRQESFREEAEHHMSGAVGQRRVPADYLRNATLPVPSIAEQERVVKWLDGLLARSGKVRSELTPIPRLVERYRRAIFASASSGRLTTNWRASNAPGEGAADFLARVERERQATYKSQNLDRVRSRFQKAKAKQLKHTVPSVSDDDDYPDHWQPARLADVVECLDYRRVPINKTDRLGRHGEIPYYGANGPVGWIDEFIFDEDLVLVVEDETFVGRKKPFSYIIRGKSWVNNHAHVLRTLSGFPTELLNVILSYYDFIPLTSGTTGRRKLTQESLMEAVILIPPPAEQLEIVRRVQAATSRIEKLLAEHARAEKLMERLAQAALAKVFGGGGGTEMRDISYMNELAVTA